MNAVNALNSDRLMRLIPTLTGPQFDLIARSHPERSDTERYISQRFENTYAAQITEFMPWLLTLRCNQNLSAATGLRPADSEKLFIERYLDQPIEAEISAICQQPVLRHGVIEIGNLVSTWKGSSQILFVILTAMAAELGFEWVVFTATAEVHKLIQRLRFTPFTLCRADGNRLGDQLERWGSYYKRDPHVMAGDLKQSYELLQSLPLLAATVSLYRNQLEELKQQARRLLCPSC